MGRAELAHEVIIGEAYRLTEGLANVAFQSSLARLPNRAALALLADAHDRNVTPRFAVAYADLTGFKAINESYGHDGGDATIREFGERLDSICQQVDGYAYHLSGDEFIALIPPEKVDEFSEAAKGIHGFNVAFEGRTIPARANFGIAMPYESGVLNELQRRAEKACSTAKTSQQSEPLVWTEAEQEKHIINKRWRCEHCQATIQILVPVEKRGEHPFWCANCHEPLAEELTPSPSALT